VYANQPSPYAGRPAAAWRNALILLAIWAALLLYSVVGASDRQIFTASHHFDADRAGEHSFVTPIFDVPGGTSNVELDISTDLDNNWAYFNLALVNEQTGQGYDLGREISYYRGSDSDGAWSEGSRKDSATIPRVPAGRYYLRIEPEMDAEASRTATAGRTMNYEIVVRRDVPTTLLFWLFLPLLLIPPIWTSIRAAAFEGTRWQESDYASSSGDDD
jgi:hypothetical protein